MIKKHGSKFVVTDSKGSKILGTHPSKKKAAKQLAAIEISKAKHMQHENKRFKDFRNTLTESEYKETLTGYPNRGINTEDGPVNFGTERVAQINAMLNAISRSTFQTAGEAFIKIRTRLNLLMLDFPWTPYMWQGGNTGAVVLTVTLFGRVDGVDGISGNIGPTNGKANPTAGLKEFTLVANIEIAEDGLYRVTAKLGPKTEPVMAEEGVEVDGDALDEMAQTPARQRDMEHKIQRHEAQAQKGYEAKMNKTGKAAARGRKLEAKHDAASRRVIKQDTKEYESEKLYGRGGKVVKSKSKPVKGIKQATGVQEELVGGQKKLDVNKNKKLDAQDFKLLRAKKSVKEYTEMMPGIPLMQPDPTMSQADQSGKSKRFHKKALKSSMEEAAKKPVKKQDPHVGAKSVIDRQKSIKKTLDQHGMRW